MVSVDPKDRAGIIGSSDAAAALGVSKYRTAFQLWLACTGQDERADEDEAMGWGKRLEPVVLVAYGEQQGVKVLPGRLIMDPLHPWRVAHTDGEVEGHSIGLDAKTAGIVGFAGSAWGQEWTDQVPNDVLVQMHHILSLVPSWEAMHIPALIAGRGLVTYLVARNEEFERYLVQREVEFWERHVVTGIPPALDGSEECARWLSRIHPKAEKAEWLDSTPAVDALVEKYRRERAAEHAAKAEKDAAANHLRQVIGEARGIKGGWGALLLKAGKTRALQPMFNDEATEAA